MNGNGIGDATFGQEYPVEVKQTPQQTDPVRKATARPERVSPRRKVELL